MADAETSEDSFFVCRVVFPVRAQQPSDVRCNERSQISKGKLYGDDDVTVKSELWLRILLARSHVHVYAHERRSREKLIDGRE